MLNALINKLTWEDIRDIATAANNVTLEDSINEEEYYSKILSSLNRRYKTLAACKERYKEILPIAEQIVGMKNRKERIFELVVLRSMVACKLREENFLIMDIGRAMGYDHSTIMHLFQKKKDFFALPLMYEREVRWFKQFDEALEDENNREY